MTILGVPARIARAAIAVLVALDLVALAGLSLHRTTTTTTTFRPAGQSAPVATGSAPTGQTTPQLPAPGVPSSHTVPVSASTDANAGSSTPTTTGTTPSSTSKKPKTPPRSTHPIGGTPPVTAAEIGTCPVKLAEPAQMGGLQSLVPFAPAFGPFSAEAFAAAAAYQPELELLGPILAQYPEFGPKIEPLLGPVLTLFGSGANSLFDLIGPLYSPHRTQVLAAETKLAGFFAPYSKELVGQPLAGCVVDLEAALVGDTTTGSAPTVRVNSLLKHTSSPGSG